MCLAVPGRIIELVEDEPLARRGRVDFGGMVKAVNLSLVPEAGLGDYVLVHVGVAIGRVDEREALRVFEYLREIGELEEDAYVKFLDEYRDATHARHYAETLRRLVTRPWTIMEVCGGQTHSIVRFGVDELLPPDVTLVHGPGCPVCVTPIELDRRGHRDRGTAGCDLHLLRRHAPRPRVHDRPALGEGPRAPTSAWSIRRSTPSTSRERTRREVVFFAVGFETTAPANAMAVHRAAREGLRNFSLLVSHVLVPPAIEAILGSPGNRVQGFLAAGHVCTVMGFEEYEPLARPISRADCGDRIRAARHPAGRHDVRPTARGGAQRGRESVRALGPSRGQPRSAAPDPRSLRRRPQTLAWHRRDCRERSGPARAVRRP